MWSRKAEVKELELRQYDSWLGHPIVASEYINKKFNGGREHNWLTYFAGKYAPKGFAHGVTLGCGSGGLERHALQLGICRDFDAYDIAPGAIEIAKKHAEEAGCLAQINYEVRDLNALSLAPGCQDVVFACQSAHHFENLEHIFSEVEKSLKPGGLFVLNEFIGPTRFQWTDKQLALANRMLAALPDRYKRSISVPSTQKTCIERPTVEAMITYDPSEAVRSGELLEVIGQRFDIVERMDFGGTLLHILLQDIVGNFDPASPEDMLVLKLLWECEDILIDSHVIDSDFTFIVARPRAA